MQESPSCLCNNSVFHIKFNRKITPLMLILQKKCICIYIVVAFSILYSNTWAQASKHFFSPLLQTKFQALSFTESTVKLRSIFRKKGLRQERAMSTSHIILLLWICNIASSYRCLCPSMCVCTGICVCICILFVNQYTVHINACVNTFFYVFALWMSLHVSILSFVCLLWCMCALWFTFLCLYFSLCACACVWVFVFCYRNSMLYSHRVQCTSFKLIIPALLN